MGAARSVTHEGGTPQAVAIEAITAGVGGLRPSSTPTTQGASSGPRWSSLKIGSRAAARRIGPEPIAKNPGSSIAQPAYWLARQAIAG